jgi:hypothetical protein
MRRVKNYEAEYKDSDDIAVKFRDKIGVHAVSIVAGGLGNPEIDLFREHGITYVLSRNEQLPYVGIERFLGNAPKGGLFLGRPESIEEALGKRGLELTPMTMVKRLAAYLERRERKQKA